MVNNRLDQPLNFQISLPSPYYILTLLALKYEKRGGKTIIIIKLKFCQGHSKPIHLPVKMDCNGEKGQKN